jgi:hypothetical protein
MGSNVIEMHFRGLMAHLEQIKTILDNYLKEDRVPWEKFDMCRSIWRMARNLRDAFKMPEILEVRSGIRLKIEDIKGTVVRELGIKRNITEGLRAAADTRVEAIEHGSQERLEDSILDPNKQYIMMIEADRVIDELRNGRDVRVNLNKLVRTLDLEVTWIKTIFKSSVIDIWNFGLFARYVETMTSMLGTSARVRSLQGFQNHALISLNDQLEAVAMIRKKAREIGHPEDAAFMTEYITSYLNGLISVRETAAECGAEDMTASQLADAVKEATELAEGLILQEDRNELAARIAGAISKAGPVPDALQAKIKELSSVTSGEAVRDALPDFGKEAREAFANLKTAEDEAYRARVLHGMLEGWLKLLRFHVDTGIVSEIDARTQITDILQMSRSYDTWLDLTSEAENVLALINRVLPEPLRPLLDKDAPIGDMPTELLLAEAKAALKRANALESVGYPIPRLINELEKEGAELARHRPEDAPFHRLEAMERHEVQIWRLLSRLNWANGDATKRDISLTKYIALVRLFNSPVLDAVNRGNIEERSLAKAIAMTDAALRDIDGLGNLVFSELVMKQADFARSELARMARAANSAVLSMLDAGTAELKEALSAESLADRVVTLPSEEKKVVALIPGGEALNSADTLLTALENAEMADAIVMDSLWRLKTLQKQFILKLHNEFSPAKKTLDEIRIPKGLKQYLYIIDNGPAGPAGELAPDAGKIDIGMKERMAAQAFEAAGNTIAAGIHHVIADIRQAQYHADRGEYPAAVNVLSGIERRIAADPSNLEHFRQRIGGILKTAFSEWFHSTVLRYRLCAITDIDLRVTLENIAKRMGEFGWSRGRDEVLATNVLKEARARLNAVATDEMTGSRDIPAIIARGGGRTTFEIDRPGPKPIGRAGRAWKWAKDRFRRRK